MDTILPIIECYKAIQSEGSQNGYPNIIVRFTGCTHRCYFGKGNWCDTWYTSIHPEKGKYTLAQIKDFFHQNQYIFRLMITGGSPTMHPITVQKIITLFTDLHKEKTFITLETEGSHYIETRPKINLISLSPKLENSIPPPGIITPKGKKVNAAFIAQHNKYRMHIPTMKKLIAFHSDYHIKIVVDKNNKNICEEIHKLMEKLSVPKEKIWLMPAGSNVNTLTENYTYLLDLCIEKGYNFTGRPHIIAFGDKREV